MNDQLLMDNYLLVLKSTVEVFVHGTLESSNQDVKTLLKCGLDEIMESQASTYSEMVDFGWYQVNNVNSTVINDTLSKVRNKS